MVNFVNPLPPFVDALTHTHTHAHTHAQTPRTPLPLEWTKAADGAKESFWASLKAGSSYIWTHRRYLILVYVAMGLGRLGDGVGDIVIMRLTDTGTSYRAVACEL